MENANEEMKSTKPFPAHRRGKIAGGLIVVGIGVMLLLREAGVEFPEFIFSWEMILIVLGLFIGVKHNFRNPSWIILIVIGGVFMMDDVFPGMTIGSYIWPLLIIFFGLVMIFKPRKKCYGDKHWDRWEHKWREKYAYENTKEGNESGDSIETVSVFGGVRKQVLSKNFKGGEVTCVFGGAEINLMQADFTGRAVLELTQVFGGTKLIIPSHWEIQHNDLVAVMGGIEDKRQIQKDISVDSEKVLVLSGICIFGGIEIKSYN
jgi:predicted membrane protein